MANINILLICNTKCNMSQPDSEDETLGKVYYDPKTVDDSKESKSKINKKLKANDEYNLYETNTLESPDSEW